jgi:uncharacterized protein YihD (DUF1040 family)
VAEEFGYDARLKDLREHILKTFQKMRAALG